MQLPSALLDAANRLSNTVSSLSFSEPVSYVYNPLEYAWEGHRKYLERFAGRQKRVVFMGMNPGPWGMSQTGVPFGEINLVRDWMALEAQDSITRIVWIHEWMFAFTLRQVFDMVYEVLVL